MKKVSSSYLNLIFFFGFFVSAAAFGGSWHYNQDAGFGIYQAEGWNVIQRGRSSRITGPKKDIEQSVIFIGSDWQNEIKSVDDLEKAIRRSENTKPQPIQVSDLYGFKTGTDLKGKYFIFRQPKNVILVEFDFRGSKDQLEEGLTSLSSLEIRTKGIEYP